MTRRAMAAGLVPSLAGVVATVIAVVRILSSAHGPAPSEGRPAVPVVLGLDAEDVARLVIEAGPARVDLVNVHGVWRPGPGTQDTAAELAGEREADLFPLRAYRALRSDPARAEFGLGAPELVVRSVDRRGGEVTVAVGAESFSGSGYYARRHGDPHLYLLTRRAVEGLRSILRGQPADAPRPAEETAALARAEQLTDPELVTNPWLAQITQEVGK
jgi:hypothetical protein